MVELEVTPYSQIPENVYSQQCWLYIVHTAIESGISVTENPRLKVPCDQDPIAANMAAIELRLDGVPFVIDYGDLPYSRWQSLLPRNRHIFKFHYTAIDFNQRYRVHSFPPISFHSWNKIPTDEYKVGDMVLCKQIAHTTWKDCHNLRSLASEILVSNFENIDTTTTDSQEVFWGKALNCLVSVHIPGAWRHSLDRGQHQLFGLGVCTISPDIWTCIGEQRPTPDVHYVRVKDDLSDLVDKIQWCHGSREHVKRIGDNAKKLFMRSPQVWDYVSDKLTRPIGRIVC